jgi:hypothetical protein
VTFTDFTIDGNQSNQSGGAENIQGGAASKLTIQRMRLINSWSNSIGLFPSGTNTASDIFISDNDFESNATRADCAGGMCGDIRIVQPLRVRIVDNRSNGSQLFALFASNVGAGQLSILGNVVNGCLSYAVALGGGTIGASGVKINNNIFSCPSATDNIVDLAYWTDVQTDDNTIYVGSGTGNGISDLPPALKVTANNNRIFGNPSGPITAACIALGGSDLTITGNICDNSSGSGIGINVGSASQSHGVTVTGNIVKNGSCASSGSKAGIEVFLATGGTAALSGVVITGNRSYDDQGTPTQGWGIGLAVAGQTTGYSDILIQGNDVRGNKTAGIRNSTSGATNLQIYGNPGGEAVATGSPTFGGLSVTNLLLSQTAPTISSGFGTSPSIVQQNGTAAFEVNVGTGGVATSGVIGLPTAANGWSCTAQDMNSNIVTRETAFTTTTVTFTAASAWTASDKLLVNCGAF